MRLESYQAQLNSEFEHAIYQLARIVDGLQQDVEFLQQTIRESTPTETQSPSRVSASDPPSDRPASERARPTERPPGQ